MVARFGLYKGRAIISGPCLESAAAALDTILNSRHGPRTEV